MPLQDITPLPTAPARTDAPEVFIERADDFVAALPGLVTEINTLGGQLELTAALINAAPAYADAGLVALTGLTSAADKVPYWTGASTSATMTVTSFARSLLDDTTAGGVMTTLGLTANGQSLVTAADYAAMKTLLGLTIGTNVQAYDAELAALAGLTSAADKLPYFTGSGTASVATFTTFGRSLVDDADAAAARTTLGVDASQSVSGSASSGMLVIGPITLTWKDISITNGSSTYGYGNSHTYGSWARAWIEGDDSIADVSAAITAHGTASATILSVGSTFNAVLFAIGV